MKVIDEHLFNDSPVLVKTYNGPPDFDFLELEQIHSNIIHHIGQSNLPGDGLIKKFSAENSKKDFRPMAIKTADCLAISYIGKNGVSIIHAGRVGLENNIHLSEELISLEVSEIYIGAHIRVCCYEVGANFKNSKFAPYLTDKNYLDLTAFATDGLKNHFKEAILTVNSNCTCCSNNKFYSYRRNKTKNRMFHILSKTE